jgi:arsenate reductase
MIDMELAVTFRIYHNPQCSKSRAALALLEERGIDVEVIEYLRHPPAKATLRSLLAKLDVPPLDLVRPNEPGYAALAAGGADAEQAWISSRASRALCSGPSSKARPVP